MSRGQSVLSRCDCSDAESHAGRPVSRRHARQRYGDEQSPSAGYDKKRISAIYDYVDELGKVLYHSVRFDPKDFAAGRPDGKGGISWGLDGTRRVLYRLPEVIEAVNSKRTIYLVEGEKDADNLVSIGLISTTNSGGARKWDPGYSETLRGAKVIILPDNDVVGLEHARSVAHEILRVGARVRIVSLPGLPEKGDVSDWLAAGGTASELYKLAADEADLSPESTSIAAPAAELPDTRARIVCLAEVQPERVDWLWGRRIPFGKLTLLEGDPGLGKSTLALDVAARLSVGARMPFIDERCEAADTLILTAEDGLGDTVRPRLEAAGANLTRIHALQSVLNGEEMDPPTLPGDIAVLEEAITRHSARLVIIDPLMAYLDGKVDSYRDQDVRRVLSRLSDVAERTGAAIVVIRHLNKTGAGPAIYRGGGSIGIIGAARSALLVARDPLNEDRRILAGVKNNLSNLADSLSFGLEDYGNGTARIVWEGVSDLSANELLASSRASGSQTSKSGEAEVFLRERLADGPVLATKMEQEALAAGISPGTLRRAKTNLRVHSNKGGYSSDGPWYWSIPTVIDDQGRPKGAQLRNMSENGNVDHLCEGREIKPDPFADEDSQRCSKYPKDAHEEGMSIFGNDSSSTEGAGEKGKVIDVQPIPSAVTSSTLGCPVTTAAGTGILKQLFTDRATVLMDGEEHVRFYKPSDVHPLR